MEDQTPFDWRPRTLRGREAYDEMRRRAEIPDVWPHPLADWGSLATIVIALAVGVLSLMILGCGLGIGISIGDWLIYGLFLEEGGY